MECVALGGEIPQLMIDDKRGASGRRGNTPANPVSSPSALFAGFAAQTTRRFTIDQRLEVRTVCCAPHVLRASYGLQVFDMRVFCRTTARVYRADCDLSSL